MAALQGAVESTAPVSRLHEHQSFSPDDFPVPTGREEEWRFTPLRRLRGDTVLRECKVTVPAEAVASPADSDLGAR
jgi:Fe-S cluster assembly protein SufD